MSTLGSLSYETVVAALRGQDEELNRMRIHTGTLIAAGSLVASFLGAQTLSRSGSGPWATLGIAAFVLSMLPCIYLLVPKTAFFFHFNGPVIYEQFNGSETTLDEIQATVAEWLQTYYDSNRSKMDSLNRYFAAASAALVAEIVFFAIGLQATI
jgi:hypothetical protein